MPTLDLKFYCIVGLAVALLGAMGSTYYYRNSYLIERANYAAFMAKVAANGERAKAENIAKERNWNEQIQGAITDRDFARSQLRDYIAKHPASRPSTSNPASPAGSSSVCFESKAYDAAFRRFGEQLDGFIQGARGIAIQGDEAAIDCKAILASWPK